MNRIEVLNVIAWSAIISFALVTIGVVFGE